MFFSPFSLLFFLFLFVALVLAFLLINIGLVTIAFEKIGLSPFQVFVFLVASLMGSNVNIPIKRIRRALPALPQRIRFFGLTYRIPMEQSSETVIAVNLGGAVLPVILSAALVISRGITWEPAIGVAVVALITYFLARPVRGLGIAIPLILPPALAAIVAMGIAPADIRPVVAYISGTVGTLLGADLLHLKDVRTIDAPVVSIGGAGTFDGIFLTGIIAVLLA